MNQFPDEPMPGREDPAGRLAQAGQAVRAGFLSHYFIHDRYGRPGKGNDKGPVEGLVGYARRNFMVPIPRFATWEAFDLWLEAQCRKRQADVLRGHSRGRWSYAQMSKRLKRPQVILKMP